jgi:hypothetical protein
VLDLLLRPRVGVEELGHDLAVLDCPFDDQVHVLGLDLLASATASQPQAKHPVPPQSWMKVWFASRRP